MEEILKKLLESEMLSEDTRSEITEQFQTFVAAQIDEQRQLIEQEVRTELTQSLSEQWVQERDALIESLDMKTDEILRAELDELKEDISAFRDLEVEYAQKLVEQKQELAEALQGNIGTLAEMLDEFVHLKLSEELEELQADITETKKLAFGKKMFESFVREYQMNFVDHSDVEKQLAESSKEVEAVKTQLAESKKALDVAVRTAKMTELLSNVSGKNRDVMETILNTLPTDKLEEGYGKFIGRVLKESAATPTAKETEVLAEGAKPQATAPAVVKTGDTQPTAAELFESQQTAPVVNKDLEKLKRWAGVSH
jgi:hypothetical protein